MQRAPANFVNIGDSITVMSCNSVIIHYNIYNNQFLCDEFTYRKNFVNRMTVTKKIGTPPARSALWDLVIMRMAVDFIA